MPRIQSDLLHLFENMGAGLLSEYDLQIDSRTCSTVMLVSESYPGSYDKGKTITLPERPEEGSLLFAGTGMSRGQAVAAGGRVLACTAVGTTPEKALAKSYALADAVSFEGKHSGRHRPGLAVTGRQRRKRQVPFDPSGQARNSLGAT